MSEADTPNDQSLPAPTVSDDHSTSELLDATPAEENLKIVKLSSELPEHKPPVQPWKPDETADDSEQAMVFLTAPQDPEAATQGTIVDASQKSSQDADWFALAQKMRQRNRNLQGEVSQLKEALKQKQEALHLEITRSQQRETTLAQQTEEFNTLHEQLARLFNALESSHQASVRQQILIETLSEQLQSGQERIAQLERECSYTQQRYNEQSHQLLQAANTCRDLRSRLQRQQQQTLQFKAALEKSLEMPKSTEPQQPHRGFVPKAIPIQPWSTQAEAEDIGDFDTIWQRPVNLEPSQPINFSKTEPFIVRRLEEPDWTAIADRSDQAESPSSVPDAIPAAPESTESELELESQLLAEMSSLAEAAGLTTVSAESETPTEAQPREINEPAIYRTSAKETLFPEEMKVLEYSASRLDEEIWGHATSQEPTEAEVVLPQSNWPSPVLYPLRPPKKRKSLAAIELPSFPRFYPS
jgi:hypothetical protein